MVTITHVIVPKMRPIISWLRREQKIQLNMNRCVVKKQNQNEFFLYIFLFVLQTFCHNKVSKSIFFVHCAVVIHLKATKKGQKPFHSIKAEAILTSSKTGRASNQIQGKGNTNSPHFQLQTSIYPSLWAPKAHQLQNTLQQEGNFCAEISLQGRQNEQNSKIPYPLMCC